MKHNLAHSLGVRSLLFAVLLASGAAVRTAALGTRFEPRRAAPDVSALAFSPGPTGLFPSAFDINTTANGARSVAVGDVDGDGDLDAVSASLNDDRIAWYENDGTPDGGWVAHDIDTSADSAQLVAVGDVDGDGDLDVLSASFNDDTIAWYENDGDPDPSWVAHVIATTADAATSVTVGDVDGDGDLDVLSASFNDDTIAWYENDGTPAIGGWVERDIAPTATAASADGARSVAVGDVDRDGDLDVLSASFNDDTIAWYENDGSPSDGGWVGRDIATSADGALAVAVGDVDGDGDLDALSASGNDDTIAWYENDGSPSNGGWVAQNITTSADGAFSVAVGDVDGDGDLDALSASRDDDTVAWYENDGSPSNGGWVARDIATSADGANSVAVGDVDGDGDLDVLSASQFDNSVTWYRSARIHGSAVFGVSTTITTSADGASSVALGDIDGDGDLDALSASTNDNRIAWYENDGTPAIGWVTRDITTSALAARSVVVGDMDGDGDLDVVSANLLSLSWYENDGSPADGGWVARDIEPRLTLPEMVTVGDLDGDGDLDVVGISNVDNKVVWFENDGSPADGGWVARDLTTALSFGLRVAVGDVDGDGDLDVLTACNFDQTVAWYENDGNPANDEGSWFQRAISISTGLPSSIVVGDVDGDGDLDVVSGSQGGSLLTWYQNDGSPADGGWTDRTIEASGFSATVFAVGDLDVDGDLDVLASAGPFSSSTTRWYENDGSPSNGGWVARDITTDAVNSVAVGDVDGDGDLDALSAYSDQDRIAWHPNRVVQFALPTTSTAPGSMEPNEINDVLKVVATSRGRAGDADGEWASMRLRFEDGSGSSLTNGEANALIDAVYVYVDADESGAFESASDTVVATLDPLSLDISGEQSVTFPAGDAGMRFGAGQPRTFFVAVRLTADANFQNPNQFRVVRLGTGMAARYASTTPAVALSVEGAADAASGVVTLCGLAPACPSNIEVSNDPGACSAVVTFATPSSGCSGATVACNPPSGSTFPVGATTVTCTATLGAGSDSCSFDVVVTDDEDPSITCPGNTTVSATSSAGAVVTFAPLSATDNCGVDTVVCTPASGSTFPFGTTPVSCVATDLHGNTDDCVFNVTVISCAATVQFSAASFSVNEGAGTATITVSRPAACGATTSVKYATSTNTATAADFTARSGTLTFGPAETSKSFTVPITSDTAEEGPESFIVTLSSPSPGTSLGRRLAAVVTIQDDDEGGVFNFATPASTVGEADGTASIAVTRSGATANTTATVKWTAATDTATAGTDFTGTSGTLTFGPGETSKSFSLSLTNDPTAEGAESVKLSLSAPTGGADLGALPRSVLTILDDDTTATGFELEDVDVEVAEGAGSASVKIVRPASLPAQKVKLATSAGTATAADYTTTSQVVSFGAGETEKTVLVPIAGDALEEGAEHFKVKLTIPTGSTGTLGANSRGVVVILDDDDAGAFEFTSDVYEVSESAGPALVGVSRTGGSSGAASVKYATGNKTAAAPGDFTAVAATALSFANGQGSGSFTVTIANDGAVEGNEVFNVTLSAPAGGGVLGARKRAVVIISDDEVAARHARN